MLPVTRIDYYLAAITNDPDAVTPLPEPVTRIDHYLAYLAGENVAELPEPVTRIDSYLAKLCGMDVEIPEEPITRIDFYLAVLNGETVETPEAITRIDYYLDQWASGSSLPWQTFTGNPLQFNAPKAHTLKSVSVAFSPIQSGSGDPSPDNVRPISGWTGVDIYDEPDYDPTATPKLTVTWTDEAGTVYGGYVRFNEDGSVDLVREKAKVFLNAFDFTTTSSPENHIFRAYYASVISPLLPSSPNFPIDAISDRYVADDWTTISGADNFKFAVSPSSPGRLVVIDHRFSTVADFVASLDGAVLVYPLATPVTYHLPSIDALKALKGINTMWTDADTLTVEARAEAVNLSALQSMQMLMGGRYVNNGTADDLSDEEALDVMLGGQR